VNEADNSHSRDGEPKDSQVSISVDAVRILINTCYSGDSTPTSVSGIDVVVKSTEIQNSVMTANVICHNCTGPGRFPLDYTSTRQPWIYAAGPGVAISSDSSDAYIKKHAHYGMFDILA
jgi:hypothetical protein